MRNKHRSHAIAVGAVPAKQKARRQPMMQCKSIAAKSRHDGAFPIPMAAIPERHGERTVALRADVPASCDPASPGGGAAS